MTACFAGLINCGAHPSLSVAEAGRGPHQGDQGGEVGHWGSDLTPVLAPG